MPLGAAFCAAANPVVLNSTAITAAHFTRSPQRNCSPV
jgi:hypothetical protein